MTDSAQITPFGGLHGSGNDKTQFERIAELERDLSAAREWREAVLNELIVAHIYTKEHDTNPRKAIQDAITWNCQVALDPAVSSDAQKLIAAAQEDLQFVERWANHHGVKPTCTAEAALSIIQHYPPILAITRSYADGKVPETRNPWAELQEAQEARKRAEKERDDALKAVDDNWVTHQRVVAAEALAESYKADAERLDWFHARAFTVYRSRDPESKALSGHVTLVNEDAKESRTGITAPTFREVIDVARGPL